MTTVQLRYMEEISFRYDGRLIDDGCFICVENSISDLRGNTNPEPHVKFPRIRCMFAGLIFGRFEIAKITELKVVK